MSEDQVTHTPTPWDLRRREDTEVLGLSKNEEGRNFYILHVAGNSHAPRAIADAEFAHTAINSHDALTARVAELESANAALMAERISYIETHRGHEETLAKDLRECRHTLGRVRADLVSSKSSVAELEAENERLRSQNAKMRGALEAQEDQHQRGLFNMTSEEIEHVHKLRRAILNRNDSEGEK